MKRHLIVALGLVLASTSVFATRARIEALGEDKDGSFYIEDSRNIFLNAAHVNHLKDSIVFEYGDQKNYDSQGSSDAEGGFFKSHGNFTYGLYFGRQADSIARIRAINSSGLINGQVQLANENNLDLYIGGDAEGIEWGAALSYSNSDKDSDVARAATDLEQSALALRLGAIMGATEAWANVSLMNKSELNNTGTVEEFEGNVGAQLGVSHGFGHGYRAYAQYRLNGGDHTVGTTTESDYDQIVAGLSKTTALNDNANLFTKLQFGHEKLEIGNTEQKDMNVNVVAGLEADVKEWLTVRASVTHTLWGTEEVGNNKNDVAESTRVAGGASLRMGDFSLDGAAGKNMASGRFGRLSATYNF